MSPRRKKKITMKEEVVEMDESLPFQGQLQLSPSPSSPGKYYILSISIGIFWRVVHLYGRIFQFQYKKMFKSISGDKDWVWPK